MRLSVIIVSYNVRYFLEQCLASVRDACHGLLSGSVEVIVVDNASSDGSLYFLRPLFTGFHFISNAENTGFSRANNLALARAQGDYILFLNPDTIVPEDGFRKAIAFMDAHPETGAAGVRMIDGRGRFLRESKRGFPGPAAAFYKMAGLAALFPRSPVFAAYYAGSPEEDRTREVDILSGACLFVRKTVLEKTGGFDERFFMYAEDIDLSWRIRQAGYRNYYLADISIIHFKGESTRRDLQYVRQFYKAMHQFRDKYGKGRNQSAEWLLRAGIGLRELLAMGRGLFHHAAPVIRLAKDKNRDPGKEQAMAGAGYILLGDPADADAVKAALEKYGLKETTHAMPDGVVVFCQAAGLSWKNIIAAISGETEAGISLIHGRDTHALVGSPAGDRPGQVIFLNA